MLLASRSVGQPFRNDSLDALLRDCLTLTYDAVHYAAKNGIATRRGMKTFYNSMKDVELPSCYKVAVITRAFAVLKSRKKSERRGRRAKQPKALRPMVCIASGFFVTAKDRLFVPLSKRNEYADVLLNHYIQKTIEGRKLRSLTITPSLLLSATRRRSNQSR